MKQNDTKWLKEEWIRSDKCQAVAQHKASLW